MVSLCTCLSHVVTATRGARTALYCALTLTTLQHLQEETEAKDHTDAETAKQGEEVCIDRESEGGEGAEASKEGDGEEEEEEEETKEEDHNVLDHLMKMISSDESEAATYDTVSAATKGDGLGCEESGDEKERSTDDENKNKESTASATDSSKESDKENALNNKVQSFEDSSRKKLSHSNTSSPKRFSDYPSMSPRRHSRFQPAGKFMPPPPPPFMPNYRKYYHNFGPPSMHPPPPPHFGMQRLGGHPPMHPRRGFYPTGLHK